MVFLLLILIIQMLCNSQFNIAITYLCVIIKLFTHIYYSVFMKIFSFSTTSVKNQ